MVSAFLQSLSHGHHVKNHSKMALPGSLVSSFVNGQAIVIMRQSGSRRGSLDTTLGMTTKHRSNGDDDSSSECGTRLQSQVLSLQEAFRSRFRRKRASSF